MGLTLEEATRILDDRALKVEKLDEDLQRLTNQRNLLAREMIAALDLQQIAARAEMGRN